MGAYIQQSDVQAAYGVANVAAWADKEATGSAGVIAAAVALAIAWAESEIDALFLESRYAVPFSPVPTKVVEWAITLAAHRLYRQRGLSDEAVEDKLKAEVKDARLSMMMYSSGVIHFPAGQPRQAVKCPSGPVVVDGDNPNPYNNVNGIGTLDPLQQRQS